MAKNTIKTTDWPLVGNNHIVSFLSKKLEKGDVAGTYIFSGPEDLGKTTVAYFFAKNLLCTQKKGYQACGKCAICRQFENKNDWIANGDFHLLKKEEGKKNISVEQVRSFISVLEMTSFSSDYKIGIIKDADTLNQEGANALLKTLEEPRQNVVIILIVSDLDILPATIKSRSQLLHFYPSKIADIYDYLIKEHGATRSQAKNFSRLCLGRPALAVKFLEDKEFLENYKNSAQIFLNFWNQNINDRLNEINNLSDLSVKKKEVKKVSRILSIWQGIVRDLLLYYFNQKDLIQHEILLLDIKKVANKVNQNDLYRINNELEKGIDYLKANVSPGLVLENIAINLI